MGGSTVRCYRPNSSKFLGKGCSTKSVLDWRLGKHCASPVPLGRRYVRTASYNSSKNRSREASSTTSVLGSYSSTPVIS